MSSYYTVPVKDGTISSVKSSVLAAGVSLLFLYIVRLGALRLTSRSRSWRRSC
jgi:hypothetical protein